MVATPESPAANRVNRRDEEEKATRIIERKLKSYDPNIVSTAMGKQSQLSVADYIIVELRNRDARDAYLSSKCWTLFSDEFELESSSFTGLPPADETFVVNDMMLGAILPAHAENPAGRSVEPAMQFPSEPQEPVKELSPIHI